VNLGVGIIGCGAVGRKRARALSGQPLIACADADIAAAEALSRAVPGAQVEPSWEHLIARSDVAVVIVATSNDALAPIATAAVRAGKHVLVEKPAGRTRREIEGLSAAAAEAHRFVRVGFNHRYHPALRQARALVDSGAIGPLMMLRGRYGHGGRLGYEREWRADPARAGGGELIDQGVHLIDLARWFLGEFPRVEGFAATYFWDMPVDDNAFLMLRTASSAVAFLHVSCTEWKNLFSLEIYGRDGKLAVDGLGGSYGVERLALYRMLPQMGPPDTTTWEFPQPDESWAAEFAEFIDDIRQDRSPAPGLDDAKATLTIVEHVYAQSGFDWMRGRAALGQ
jgi:predicted dehydrogenase